MIKINTKEIKIYNTKESDLVLSYNIERNTPEYRRILKVHDVTVKHKDQIEIKFNKSSYITSIWHPTLIKRENELIYVRADEVVIGDETVNEYNEIVRVTDINKSPNVNENYADLTVSENENYYCSNDKKEYHVVHNTRSGAIAVYCESWHKDIFDFLDMKKNSGDEKRRAKELFIAVSCSDLFMNKVINDEIFTTFDPYDVPELTETYGEEFEKIYNSYEEQYLNGTGHFTNPPVQVKAKELWKKLQRYYWETGMPFLFFKDNVNTVHENKEEGIVRSSNLCTEIMQTTDHDRTALCNLGSLNLAKVNTKEDLEYTIGIAMRMLDNVIDVTTYPVAGTEDVQKHTRAVGLGICGEGELVANKQIMYGSEIHQKYIDELYGNIAELSDKASEELAKERGPWKAGKTMRNAYRRALAPTSSISILMGTTAMHECAFDKVWVEENKLGNIKMTAPNINPNNFAFYVNPYDIDQADAVRCHAIRTKHLDQGGSFNFYYRPGVKGKVVFDNFILAWKLGFKSTYYLRSEGVKGEETQTKTDKISCVGCEN